MFYVNTNIFDISDRIEREDSHASFSPHGRDKLVI